MMPTWEKMAAELSAWVVLHPITTILLGVLAAFFMSGALLGLAPVPSKEDIRKLIREELSRK